MTKALNGIGEVRIPLSTAQQKKFEERWNSIEGTEERKQVVLERCRAEREARKRR